MARLIDADKIDYTVTMVGMDEYAGYRAVAFESDIDDMPTVDAVEVVHGEWQFGNRNGQYGYYCSKCNTGFTGENAHWIAREHLYCPHCGAKMDGERKVSE